MADTQQETPRHEHAGPGHGNSVAAWTAVSIIMVGFLIMAVAVAIRSLWVFIVGALILVLGVVTGKVLSAMGLGSKERSTH